MSDKEYFKGVCPYTNKPCKIWLCRLCSIEHRERVWMKMLDKGAENENMPFTSQTCPSCGNSMWGYENGKIVCAVCGNKLVDVKEEAENEHL